MAISHFVYIHQLMDAWVVSTFWLWCYEHLCTVFVWTYVFYFLRWGIVESYGNLFRILRNQHYFQSDCSPGNVWGLRFHISLTLVIIYPFDCSHPTGCEVSLTVISICISLTIYLSHRVLLWHIPHHGWCDVFLPDAGSCGNYQCSNWSYFITSDTFSCAGIE